MTTPASITSRFGAFLPLAAVGVELVWLLFLLMLYLFKVGDVAPKKDSPQVERTKTRIVDVIAMIPAAVGLLTGVVAIVRGWPHGAAQWTCLIIGCVGCALFVVSFGSEFLFG